MHKNHNLPKLLSLKYIEIEEFMTPYIKSISLAIFWLLLYVTAIFFDYIPAIIKYLFYNYSLEQSSLEASIKSLNINTLILSPTLFILIEAILGRRDLKLGIVDICNNIVFPLFLVIVTFSISKSTILNDYIVAINLYLILFMVIALFISKYSYYSSLHKDEAVPLTAISIRRCYK